MPPGNRAPIKTAGVIGLGVGMQHALAYESLGLEVLVCDFDMKKEGPNKIWRITDWEKLIDLSDIVSVCSWDQYHEEQVIYALEQDKHVLCEKPLAHTRESLERIRAAAEKSKGILAVSFPLRKTFAELRPLHSFNMATFGYFWGRNQKLHDGWRQDSPNYNVSCGGLIHMIDLCDFVLDFGVENDSIDITQAANLNSPKEFDYDLIQVQCKNLAGEEVCLIGDFSKDDDFHMHHVLFSRNSVVLRMENFGSADKKQPAIDFYNAVTHPTLKFCPDPFSANETAIVIHEKALEYLRGKD